MNDNNERDPRLYAIPDTHGHAKGEHKPFAEERPLPLTARMLFLWFYHACRRGYPRFLMVADHMNYLTFEDPAAVNLVRRALKLAQAGDLYGAAETASVDVAHAAVVSEGLRRGMRYSIGAEVDNDPRSRPDAQNIVDAMRPDAIIRSVHFIPITHPVHGENWPWPFDNPEFQDLFEVVGVEQTWELYVAALVDAIERLPGHIVGHFFVPAVFGHWPDDAKLDEYENRVLDAAAARGMAVEFNTRFFYRDHDDALKDRYLAANMRFLRKAKERGVQIAIGSDAHSPKDQGGAFDVVLHVVDQLDINELAFPMGGSLRRVALRIVREPEPEPVPEPTPEPAKAPERASVSAEAAADGAAAKPVRKARPSAKASREADTSPERPPERPETAAGAPEPQEQPAPESSAPAAASDDGVTAERAATAPAESNAAPHPAEHDGGSARSEAEHVESGSETAPARPQRVRKSRAKSAQPAASGANASEVPTNDAHASDAHASDAHASEARAGAAHATEAHVNEAPAKTEPVPARPAAAKPATEKTPAKTAPAKTAPAKTAPAKAAPAKAAPAKAAHGKPAAAKPAAKPAPARAAARAKPAAKKAAPVKAGAKKAGTAKASKKAAPARATVKKGGPAKKAAPAKKTPSKKSAPARATAKKAAPAKKATAKKAPPSRKAPARKATAAKKTTKKTAKRR